MFQYSRQNRWALPEGESQATAIRSGRAASPSEVGRIYSAIKGAIVRPDLSAFPRAARKTGARPTNPIKSGPASALDQVNDHDDDDNHEQKMDQTAAKVADEAEKPEHYQDDNYSPEHGVPFD